MLHFFRDSYPVKRILYVAEGAVSKREKKYVLRSMLDPRQYFASFLAAATGRKQSRVGKFFCNA